MSGDKDNGISSSPRPESGSPSHQLADSLPRHIATARLATPVPASPDLQALSVNPSSNQDPTIPDSQRNFSSVENEQSLPGPRHSFLASALQDDPDHRVPIEAPPRSTASPILPDKAIATNYGSFDTRSGWDTGSDTAGGPIENPDIIRRHLVQPTNGTDSRGSRAGSHSGGNGVPNEDEFSSLQLQGGDITRPIYRWTEEAQAASNTSRRRRSFDVTRPEPESQTLNINSIKVPGGFRRDYIRRTVGSPEPQGLHGTAAREQRPVQPVLLTSNFLEFLTVFGHFAGEELEEDDEMLAPDEYFSPETWGGIPDEETGERSALLGPETPGKRARKHKERGKKATNSATGAVLLLLKSFVGTGVLFLPRAFLNGGMIFSSAVLVAVSLLSYYCFILLVRTRLKFNGSFGDIGGALYGKHMRRIILGSIVLSQIGFVSAYIVFVSTNMQAFVLAVSKCKSFIDIKLMILMQLIIFLPLSFIRDISKLGFTALVADVFILLGLIYLYGYDIMSIVDQGGVADIKPFNPSSWTLFIGTAIFTYEGVGLIIPIQESMKRPQQFPSVLAFVMVIVTVVFLSAGALGYATFGSATETVVILNLPQDNRFVNGIQFLYSIAILLSTPLQLFPAIRILENELFSRSGKFNPGIKWKKNGFRSGLVVFCALVAWGGAADLDKFVALVGSFACVPLVYVYPVSFVLPFD